MTYSQFGSEENQPPAPRKSHKKRNILLLFLLIILVISVKNTNPVTDLVKVISPNKNLISGVSGENNQILVVKIFVVVIVY